jgi:hypothetical protein
LRSSGRQVMVVVVVVSWLLWLPGHGCCGHLVMVVAVVVVVAVVACCGHLIMVVTSQSSHLGHHGHCSCHVAVVVVVRLWLL